MNVGHGSYYGFATPRGPARISKSYELRWQRRDRLTTDGADFTDGTDEEDDERFGFRFICVIREIGVIRGAAASAWLWPHVLVLMFHEPVDVGCQSIR